MAGFGFSCTTRQEQSVKQETVLGHVFSLRMELIEALRGERYRPRGICPSCGRKLKPEEIIAGFNRDPNDFTTKCPGCGTRFQPILICFGREMNIELPFFCSAQTLAQMRGKEALPPEEFAWRHPAIYRAAIVHHGGVRQAFAKIGIEYPFEEALDWRNKIRPFLGRLPDTIVAKCANVSARVIGAMRRKLGVKRYAKSVTLDEIGSRE